VGVSPVDYVKSALLEALPHHRAGLSPYLVEEVSVPLSLGSANPPPLKDKPVSQVVARYQSGPPVPIRLDNCFLECTAKCVRNWCS
jgi:hypothetical protein